MDDNNKNDKENSIGYFLGTLLGSLCVVCAAVAVLAVTVKFIMWMF